MVLVVALPNYNTFEITRLLLIHIATIASILCTSSLSGSHMCVVVEELRWSMICMLVTCSWLVFLQSSADDGGLILSLN